VKGEDSTILLQPSTMLFAAGEGKSGILEIRVGTPTDPSVTRESKPCWPVMENGSAYAKHVVGPTVQVSSLGIEGNAAGYPGHIDDKYNRAICVFNERFYDTLKELFPGAKLSLVRGGFGENLVVDNPDLMHSAVCVGDKYQIGTTVCVVTGPRAPCPKVDGWHGVKGMTAYCRENGAARYFMKVIQGGQFSLGDEFVLLERPHPTYTIERISQGIWGPEGLRDDRAEFLTAVAGMPDLIRRHYRDTAVTRLERLQSSGET
jgi:MOSC domain-containing protein YiiM